jgi:hypothetical protein
MAIATINFVYCVQVSSGTAVPVDFFTRLVDLVGEVLLPQSVNEVIDKVQQAISGLNWSVLYGADNLYINVDGNQKWPIGATAVEIDSGQPPLPVDVSFPVTGDHWLQLVEYDGGGADDDDMGGCWVQLGDQGQGQIAKLVKHEGEGSAYYVFYQVD